MDGQLLFNIVLGVAGTLAGWFFEVIYDQIKDLQEEVNFLEERHDEDNRQLHKDLSRVHI